MFVEFPSIRAFIGPKAPQKTSAEKAIDTQEARKLMSKLLEKLS